MGVDRADVKILCLMVSQVLYEQIIYMETYGVIEKLASRFKETLCGKDDHNRSAMFPLYEKI